MLTASGFRIVYCQGVIYTPNLQFRTATALNYLLGKHSDKFNADPISLPIPESAPGEFPRLVLQSQDAQLKLQASPARLDVFQEGEDITPEALKQFFEFAVSLFAGYLEAMPSQAWRVACVVRRFAPDANGATNLAAHFCKDKWLADPLNRPSDFELDAAKQFKFGGWLGIGSWFRCRSVNMKFGDGPLSPGVMIEQDFNSAAVSDENAKPLSVEEIQKFFEDAPAELLLVVRRYFPPQEGDHA
jgi:hypothetical protein